MVKPSPAWVQVQFSVRTMSGSTTPSELNVPAVTTKNSRLSAASVTDALGSAVRAGAIGLTAKP